MSLRFARAGLVQTFCEVCTTVQSLHCWCKLLVVSGKLGLVQTLAFSANFGVFGASFKKFAPRSNPVVARV